VIPAAAPATVLALNSGSSSLKFGLYRVDAAGVAMRLAGEAQAIGSAQSRFTARAADGQELACDHAPVENPEQAVQRVARILAQSGAPAPTVIGHRVVHGGARQVRHCLIDAAVRRELEEAAIFAPLHGPAALAVIDFASRHFAGVPQVACLDTAFHADMPDVARTLPIGRDLAAAGIRRYGFHGLSCESIVRQLGDGVPERLVIAHLGNGASVTAVRHGRSVDTSMGLTPSGGVLMGTRSGDLDPGVLVYLMRARGLDADGIEALVNRGSGLLGISGIASDMRALHAAEGGHAEARLAVRMFCYAVCKQVAAMAAALGGLDCLVLTGGIGENDAEVRGAICRGLAWLPPFEARTMPAQEEAQVALHAWTLAPPG
jgi:acetate kinase